MRPTTFICALAATLQLLTGTALADGWAWPIRGPVITPYRNGDDPYASGQHRGIDIGAPVGAGVVAATAGTVTFSGVVGSSGLVVSERSADGRFDLSYLHLSSASVHRGDSVGAGTRIGAVGTSGGRSADAPHLHFGVRDAGARSAYRDPLDFLSAPPAADRPEPAPAPVPAGDPVAVQPAPSPGHAAPVPSPAQAPSPAHAPFPARGPSPAGAPAPGTGAPLGGGVAHLLAPHEPVSRHALSPRALSQLLAPTPDGHTAPGRPPAAARMSPGGAHVLAGDTGPRGSTHAVSNPDRSRSAAHRHHGINLGWLAACVGLIALATALGHPGGTQRVARRGRVAAGRGLATLRHRRARVGAFRRHPARQ
jgi:hypothetical protein